MNFYILYFFIHLSNEHKWNIFFNYNIIYTCHECLLCVYLEQCFVLISMLSSYLCSVKLISCKLMTRTLIILDTTNRSSGMTIFLPHYYYLDINSFLHCNWYSFILIKRLGEFTQINVFLLPFAYLSHTIRHICFSFS